MSLLGFLKNCFSNQQDSLCALDRVYAGRNVPEPTGSGHFQVGLFVVRLKQGIFILCMFRPSVKTLDFQTRDYAECCFIDGMTRALNQQNRTISTQDFRFALVASCAFKALRELLAYICIGLRTPVDPMDR